MNFKWKKAFTLVELIIVASILIVLWIIWTVVFSGHLSHTRDGVRTVELKNIYTGLDLISVNKASIPLPNYSVNISDDSWNIAYQWEISENILNQIQIDSKWIDPQTWEYYNYFLSEDRKSIKLLTYLENPDNSNKSFSQYASFPFVSWDDNSFFLIDPLTEQSIHYDNDDVNLSTINENYYALLSNDNIIYWNNNKLSLLWGIMKYWLDSNCKELIDNNRSIKWKNGTYSMYDDDEIFQVYCDMTIDWWGWTIATMHAGLPVNLFNTGIDWYVESVDSNISSKWTIETYWNDIWDRDLLLQCFTSNSSFGWYTQPLIIYDYKKNNIDILLNDNKNSVEWSDTILKWKWKDTPLYIYNDLWNTWNSYSFELFESDNDGNKWSTIFELDDWKSLVSSNSAKEFSSAYKSTTGSTSMSLNSSNYCIVWLR